MITAPVQTPAHIWHVEHMEHLAHLRAERESYSSWTPSPSSSGYSPAASSSDTSSPSSSSSTSSDSSLSDVPGVPSSFAACVAYRESTDGTNAAYNGGTYGIITASGINVNGQSLAAQKAAFRQIYDTTGPSAWAADHCPGT